MKEWGNILGVLAIGIAAIGGILGPFVTHVVWCINHASETGSAIALLIVGVMLPPVGWAHGLSVWLGFTWV